MGTVSWFPITVAGAVAALVLCGCGSSDSPETPVACLAPPSSYLTALEDAPGPVFLADGTSISACLVDEQEAGALAGVGRSVIATATRLNEQARRDPGGEATVELGYLVGAVQEAAATTGGIHEDLKLRLDSAARFSPQGKPLPLDFERAFGEGYAAGQREG